jgi:hypothetical protein
VIAVLAGLGALGALGACGEEAEPRFHASCTPDPALEKLACTITNQGTKAGRACLTARLQPEQGAAIIARRACTSVLAPEQSAVVTPAFEQLATSRARKTLASRCAKDGRWSCVIDIVENSRQLGENLPAER